MARELTPLGKNAKYWATRAKIAQMSSDQSLERYKDTIKDLFDEANEQINDKIKDLYVKFAHEEGVSKAQAQKMLNSDELKEFNMSLQEYIKEGEDQNDVYSIDTNKRLARASAKYRLSRLEATKYQLQAEVNKLFKNLDEHYTDWNSNEYQERYYKQLFDFFQGIGVGYSFAHINQRDLDLILKKPWTGNQNFSQRLWKHKEDLIPKLQQALEQSLTLGQSYSETSKNLSEQLNVKQECAARLISTESSFFNSMGQKKAFEELGVERYQDIAVLDNETCSICAKMDGKTFKVAAMKIGKNAPPYHPNCRDTIAPYYNDKKIEGYVEGVRAARNSPDEKTYYVPANMKYEQWAKENKVIDNDGNYIVEPDYEVFDENGKSLYLGNFQKGLKAKHFKKIEPLRKNNKDILYNQLFNKHVPKTTVIYDKDSPGHFSYAKDEVAINPNRADNEEKYLYKVVPHEGAHAIDSYAYDDLMRGRKDYQLAGTLSETYKKGILAKTINNDFDDLLTPYIKQQKNIKNIPVGSNSLETILQKLDKDNQLNEKDRDRIATNLSRLLSSDKTINKKAIPWKEVEDVIDNNKVSDKNDIVSKWYRSIIRKLPKNIKVKDIENEYNKHLVSYLRMDDEPELEKIDWRKALEALKSELRNKYDYYDLSPLSDMFQGYTESIGGRDLSLNLNGAGHDTGYFYGPHMQSAEFLAEYYENKLTNPKAFKIIKEVLPNACKIPDEMLKSALNREAHHFTGFGGEPLNVYNVEEKVKGKPFEVALGYNDKGDIEDAIVIGDEDNTIYEKEISGKSLKNYKLDKFKNVFDQQFTDNIHKALQDASDDFNKAWNKHINKVNAVTVNNLNSTGYNYLNDVINMQPNDLMQYGLETPIHEGTHAVDRMAGRERFGHDVYFSHAYENGIIQKTLNEEWKEKVKKIFLDTYDRDEILDDLDKLDDMQMFSALMGTKMSADDSEYITDEMDKGESFKQLVTTNPQANMIFNKNYKIFQDVAFNNLSQQDKMTLLSFLRQDLIDKYGTGPDVNSLSDMYQAFCERWVGKKNTLNGFGHPSGYFAQEPSNQSAEFVAQYHASTAANKKAAEHIEEEFPKTVAKVHQATAEMGK